MTRPRPRARPMEKAKEKRVPRHQRLALSWVAQDVAGHPRDATTIKGAGGAGTLCSVVSAEK